MKCKHCHAEWSNPGTTSVVLKNCPFCGQSLMETSKPLNSMEAVLTEIMSSYGIEVLQNGKNLLAYFSDLAPNLKKEKQILSYLIECGGHTQILSVLKKDPKEHKTCVEGVVFTMSDRLLLDKTIAQTACYTFYAVVSGQPLEAVMPKPVASAPSATSAAPKQTASAPTEPTPEEHYQKGKQYAQSKDYKNAVEWYRKAAEQGHAEAQYQLGWLYRTGLGIQKDDRQGFAWIVKAAENGCATAQYELGKNYEYSANGNVEQTIYWYSKAAEQGHKDAQTHLRSIEADQDQKNERLFDFNLCFDTELGSYYEIRKLKANAPTELIFPSRYKGISVRRINRNTLTFKTDHIRYIHIPNGVTRIESHSFSLCYKLIKITIPNSVTIIGDGAFSMDNKLKEIIFNGTKMEWKRVRKEKGWKSNTGNFTVHCTDGKIPKFLA